MIAAAGAGIGGLGLMSPGVPHAQAPSEFAEVAATLAGAETLFLAFSLPPPPPADHAPLHGSSPPRALLRVDDGGFVVDADLGTARLHYDAVAQTLHYDDGTGPVANTEDLEIAAAIHAGVRVGFEGWEVISATSLPQGVGTRPWERWFELRPPGGWSDTRLWISAHLHTGRPHRVAVTDAEGIRYMWRGARLVGSIAQLDVDVPLEGDMAQAEARPFHAHGIPETWREAPPREEADFVFHERLQRHALLLRTDLGDPVFLPAPTAQHRWFDATCGAPEDAFAEGRRFVWDVDPAAPSHAAMLDAHAQGCTLEVGATVDMLADLEPSLTGFVVAEVVGLDLGSGVPNTRFVDAVDFVVSGPPRSVERHTSRWILPGDIAPDDVRFEVSVTLQGSCDATQPAPSTLYGQLRDLDQPTVTWTCP